MDIPFQWMCLMILFLHTSGQIIAATNRNTVQGTFPKATGLSMPIRSINSPVQKGGRNEVRISDPRLAALMGTKLPKPGVKTNHGNLLSRMPSTQVTMAPGIQRSSLGSPYPNTAYSTSQSRVSVYAVQTTPSPRSRTLPTGSPVVSNEFVPPAPKRTAIQSQKEQLRSNTASLPYQQFTNSRQTVQTFNKHQNAHTPQQVLPGRRKQEQMYNNPNNAAKMQQQLSQPIKIQTSGGIQKPLRRQQHPTSKLQGQNSPSNVSPRIQLPKRGWSRFQGSKTSFSALQTPLPFQKNTLPRMGRTQSSQLGVLQDPPFSQNAEQRIRPGQNSSSIVSKNPNFPQNRVPNRNKYTEISSDNNMQHIPSVDQNEVPRKKEHIQISSANILRNLPVDHQLMPRRINNKQDFSSYAIQNPQTPQQIAPKRTNPAQISSTSFQNPPVQQQRAPTTMENTQTSSKPLQNLRFTNTLKSKKRDFAKVSSLEVMQTRPIPQQPSHFKHSHNSWSDSKSQIFPVYKNVAARRMEPRQIDPSSNTLYNSPNSTPPVPEKMKPIQPLQSKSLQIQPIQQRKELRRNIPVYQRVMPNKGHLQISSSNILRQLPIDQQFMPQKLKPGKTSYIQNPHAPQQLGSGGTESKQYPSPRTLQTKPVQTIPIPLHPAQTEPVQTVPLPIHSGQTQSLQRKSVTTQQQKSIPVMRNQQTSVQADGNTQPTSPEPRRSSKSQKKVERIPTIINGKKYMIDPLFIDIVKKYFSRAGLKMTIGLSKNVMQTLPGNKPSMIRPKIQTLDPKAGTKINSGVNSNQGILNKTNNLSRRGEINASLLSNGHVQTDTTKPYFPQPNTSYATKTFIPQNNPNFQTTRKIPRPTSAPSTRKIGVTKQPSFIPKNSIPQTTVTIVTPSSLKPLLSTTTAPKRRKALLLPFRKSPVKPTTTKPVTKSTLRPTLPYQNPPVQKTTSLPNIKLNTPTNKIKGILSNTIVPTSPPRNLLSRKTTSLVHNNGPTSLPRLSKPTPKSSSGSLVVTKPIIDSPPKSETQISNPVSTLNIPDNNMNAASNTRPSVSNALLPSPYVKPASHQLSNPDQEKPKTKKQANENVKDQIKLQTFTRKKPVKVQLGFHLNHFSRKKSKQEKSDIPKDSDGFIFSDIYRQNDGLIHSNTVGVHRGFVGFNNEGNNVELLVLR
ncbi:mucin-2-like [Saccostrea echinata]|uniref:mucin-2-like n=1 Tax=Saccostrea echinata TaxID=191078 RepID=UPI002A800EC3|nr:mucin-2-like [Saccostrea echinata]